MSLVSHGSYFYSVSLDCCYDEVIVSKITDPSVRNETYINQHLGEVLCRWGDGSTTWKTFAEGQAHDWVYQTMHFRDVSTSSGENTGACLGESGYYKKAKEAYQSFDAATPTAIAADANWGNAQNRLIAWGAANGETVSFEGTTMNVVAKSAGYVLPSIGNSDNNLWVIASVAGFGVIGAAIVAGTILRRKKQN